MFIQTISNGIIIKGSGKMANWLRGVIHLRGSKQSLRKFVLNLIDPDDLEAANVNENSLYLKTTSHVGFHIANTSYHTASLSSQSAGIDLPHTGDLGVSAEQHAVQKMLSLLK